MAHAARHKLSQDQTQTTENRTNANSHSARKNDSSAETGTVPAPQRPPRAVAARSMRMGWRDFQASTEPFVRNAADAVQAATHRGRWRANPARKTSQCVYCPSLERVLDQTLQTAADVGGGVGDNSREGAREHNVLGRVAPEAAGAAWAEAAARAADVDVGRAALQIITSKYSPRDIFNMDETVYFCRMTPATSVTSATISGRKKIKKWLTVAITTNADGSFKVPLLFVGTARQPRCFSSQSASELGVDYTNAAKGWMTMKIFRSWLTRFNETMQGEDRYVLLFNNASPHRVTEHFSNVTLHFLPPNTTAHLQQQDAVIIQPFKSQLNKIRNAYVVDKLDGLLEQVNEVGKEDVELNAERLFNASILVAMRWTQQALDMVMEATVANCWRHTGIIAEEIFELVAGMDKLRIGPHSITSS